MKYMGSKNRIAKYILPIMLERRGDRTWVEPFVGGANMIDKVGGDRVGGDTNRYVIALFQAMLRGWTPPTTITVEQYNAVRDKSYAFPDGLVAFVGLCCSYAGKWFGGYARGTDSKGVPRNYAAESVRHLVKQIKNLQDVEFHCCSYDELPIPPDSLIYCDPPYAGTTGYKDTFDHEKFWQWVREKVAEGHLVYVSEYTAPDDFVSVWEKEVNNTLVKDTGSKKGIEKLFIHESQVR